MQFDELHHTQSDIHLRHELELGMAVMVVTTLALALAIAALMML